MTFIRFIAWNQFLGGIAGLLSCVWYLVHPPGEGTLVLIVWLATTLLYLLSLTAGYQLLSKAPRGVLLSKLCQMLQFVAFSANGYAFKYVAGVGCRAGLDLTNGFNLTASFEFLSVELAIGLS